MLSGSKTSAVSNDQPSNPVVISHPERAPSQQPKPDQAEVTETTNGAGKRTLELSREDFSKLAVAQRNRRAIAFGEIVRLLSQDPRYKILRLEELQWLLMPAVASGQYLIGERKSGNGAQGGISGALLWARVSDEVDVALSGTDKPVRLAPAQWRSGESVWLIAATGSGEGVAALMAEFKRRIIPGRVAKAFAVDNNGVRTVTVIQGIVPETPPTSSEPGAKEYISSSSATAKRK